MPQDPKPSVERLRTELAENRHMIADRDRMIEETRQQLDQLLTGVAEIGWHHLDDEYFQACLGPRMESHPMEGRNGRAGCEGPVQRSDDAPVPRSSIRSEGDY